MREDATAAFLNNSRDTDVENSPGESDAGRVAPAHPMDTRVRFERPTDWELSDRPLNGFGTFFRRAYDGCDKKTIRIHKYMTTNAGSIFMQKNSS